MMSEFNISAISVKAQRKLASGLSNRKTARLILDDRANNLLDKAYRVLLLVASGRREAEKVTKSIIKLVVKIGLLARQDQFNGDEDVDLSRQLRQRFRNLVMSVSSFHRIEFTYDRCFLLEQLEACRSLLMTMLAGHLTEKSRDKLELVFEFFCRPQVLDAVFQAPAESSLRTAFTQLCRELDDFVDNGFI